MGKWDYWGRDITDPDTWHVRLGIAPADALRMIHDVMDGQEWSADTLDRVASVLGRTVLGYPAEPTEGADQ
jgi:hypothetical protein